MQWAHHRIRRHRRIATTRWVPKNLELGVAEHRTRRAAGTSVGLAEGVGTRPGLELLARLPDRVRDVERLLIGAGSPQQLELPEAGHLVEMTVPLRPDPLEVRLLARLEAAAAQRSTGRGCG